MALVKYRFTFELNGHDRDEAIDIEIPEGADEESIVKEEFNDWLFNIFDCGYEKQ